jgi:hypothetical protein
MDICMVLLAHEVFLLGERVRSADVLGRGMDPSLATRYMEELCGLAKDVRSVSDMFDRLLGNMSKGEKPETDIHLNVFHRALALSTVIEGMERTDGRVLHG